MSWQDHIDQIVDGVVAEFDDMEDDDTASALEQVVEGLEGARGQLTGEALPIETRYTFTCYACPTQVKTNEHDELVLITARHHHKED